MDALLDNVLRFSAFLRDAGVSVNAGRMPDVVTAVEAIGVRRRGDVRAAMRSLLIHRHEDIPRFDAAFERFWRARAARVGGVPVVSMGERPRVTTTPGPGTPVQFDSEPAPGALRPRPLAAGAWSGAEALKTRDFAELTPGELMEAEALLARLSWRLVVGRRDDGSGPAPDASTSARSFVRA